MEFLAGKQASGATLASPGGGARQRRQLLQRRPHPDPSRLEDEQVIQLLSWPQGDGPDTSASSPGPGQSSGTAGVSSEAPPAPPATPPPEAAPWTPAPAAPAKAAASTPPPRAPAPAPPRIPVEALFLSRDAEGVAGELEKAAASHADMIPLKPKK